MKADNKEKKLEVARSISIDVLNFPCGFCQKDASEYIRTHSMHAAISSDDPYSLFYYTVDFHNYVNLKLKKSIGSVDYETAIRMWRETDVCVGDCGLEEEDIDRERPSSVGSTDSIRSDQIVMKSY